MDEVLIYPSDSVLMRALTLLGRDYSALALAATDSDAITFFRLPLDARDDFAGVKSAVQARERYIKLLNAQDAAQFSAALATAKAADTIMRLRRMSGKETLWVEARVMHLDEHRYLFSERSVEAELEMEKARREAREANAASDHKTRFLTNISHELRTPLNAILGYAELLQADAQGAQAAADARRISEAGEMLLELVNNLLDLSRVESGRFSVREENYSVTRMLDELKSSILPRVQQKPVIFSVYCTAGVPERLYGDCVLIKQVAMNLLTNAVKYTERGAIDLRVDYVEGSLVLAVRDTGMGIHPQELDKIFGRFERLEDRAHEIEGTGLGLPLTREIVESLGGRITVTSTFGEGSEFIAIIPQCRATERADAGAGDGWITAPGARVLLVDDNSVNLRVLERLLHRFEVETESVESGAACLESVAKSHFDLVLLDQMMPHMDGIETLKRLRALPDGPNDVKSLPVVALTANAMKGMREFYIERGFSDYLSKPTGLAALGRILKNLLPAELQQASKSTAISESALPPELEGLEGIDTTVGREYTGSYTNLIAALKNFALQIPDQAGRLRTALEKGDIDRFTIEVHALKSAAHMVGAMMLARQAAYMEKCGREGRRDVIEEQAPQLLEGYLSYRERLAVLLESDMPARHRVAPEKLIAQLEALKASLEDFDLDAADNFAAEARGYALSPAARELLDALCDEIRQIHYQAAIDGADALIAAIKEENK